jgi:hypothetical protein
MGPKTLDNSQFRGLQMGVYDNSRVGALQMGPQMFDNS